MELLRDVREVNAAMRSAEQWRPVRGGLGRTRGERPWVDSRGNVLRIDCIQSN